LQIWRKGDDAKAIFSQRHLGCPGVVATEYNLQKIIRDIAVCIDYMMLEVNVPAKFSGT
jgi:hypothetical protein